jgi:hypothetical protein
LNVSVAPAVREDFPKHGERAPALFSFEFVEALSRATGFPNVSVRIESRGERFVLPVLRRKAFGIIPLDFSLPFGMHGSLFPEPVDAASYGEILMAARRFLGAGLVVHNCSHRVEPKAGVVRVATHLTHLFRTRDTSYEELFEKTFDYPIRRKIRKAEKSGLDLASGNDAAFLDTFFRLYVLSNARWGKRKLKYRHEFFRAFAGAPFLEVKVASLAGRPVAGIVVLKFPEQHLYWFGAMDAAYDKLCAPHLLLSRAIRGAIEANAGVFNFGPSGKLEGVRRFKESFRAETLEYGSYFAGNSLVARVLENRMASA